MLRVAVLAGFLVIAPLFPTRAATAQGLPGDSLISSSTVLAIPGGALDKRQRLSHLNERSSTPGYLLRSSTGSLIAAADGTASIRVLLPHFELKHNSEIPFTLNDGSLWAGRGLNGRLTFGFTAQRGGLKLVLAPQLVHSENAHFDLPPPELEDQSIFAAPWYRGPDSADLPLRLGSEPYTGLQIGESTLAYSSEKLLFGISSASQWWGPGIENALIISNNAPGFPHLFVGTDAPLSVLKGKLEGKLVAGVLSPSLVHGGDDSGRRSLSGLVAAYRPDAADWLTVGAARVVYASLSNPVGVVTRVADVFTRWSTGRDTTQASAGDAHEQMLSVFARGVFPGSGAELYAEWARVDLPDDLRDFLLVPDHTQGYTLGLAWARPVFSAVVRLGGEVTYLEESAAYSSRPGRSFYTSRVIPEGYTNQGRSVGAAIGPGGSSQTGTADVYFPGGSLGLFAGRIRWANDAYYRAGPGRTSYLGHDVLVFGGVRGGWDMGSYMVEPSVAYGMRYNFLFQNPLIGIEGEQAVDVANWTLQLSIAPGR